jgi:hypothetical protein
MQKDESISNDLMPEALTQEDKFWEEDPEDYYIVEGGLRPIYFHIDWKVMGMVDNWAITYIHRWDGVWLFHTCTQRNGDSPYGTYEEATKLTCCPWCEEEIPKNVIDTAHLLAMGGIK